MADAKCRAVGFPQQLTTCFQRLTEAEDALLGIRSSLCELWKEDLQDGPSGAPPSRFRPKRFPENVVHSVAQDMDMNPLNLDQVSTIGALNSGNVPSMNFEVGSTSGWQSSSTCNVTVANSMTDKKTFPKTWSSLDQQSEQRRVLVDQVVVEALDHTEQRLRNRAVSRTRELGSGETKPSSKFLNDESPSCRFDSSLASAYADCTIARLCGCVPMLILHPDSKFRLAWIAIGFMFIVYEAYAVPVFLAFEINPSGLFHVFVNIVNCYFVLDIALTFLTGYVDPDGSLITNPTRIAMRYFKTWFVLDIVAGVPWDWVGTNSSAKLARSIRLVRAVRLLRLARLLRLMKLKPLLEKMETLIEANQFAIFLVGVMRVLFALYAVTHWAACIWFVIGKSQTNAGSWLDHPLPASVSDSSQPFKLYIFALYFTLTTMTTVGYGDITASNYPEVTFVLALLCIASVVFAGLMGVLMDLIAQLQSAHHIKQEKKTALSRYMRWRAVPRKLRMSMRQHMVFLWDTNEGYDSYEEDIKAQLPPVLKTELCYHIYGRVLEAAPFLSWMKDCAVCVKQLAELVHSIFYVQGDSVFRMGQPNDQIYVLISGKVFLSRNEAILGEREAQDASERGADGFVIPRHHTNSITDVSRKLAFTARMLKTPTFQESVTLASARKGHTSTPTHNESVPEERTIREGFNIFDSEVLKSASVALKRDEQKKKAAALLLQRAWRRKLEDKHKTANYSAVDEGCESTHDCAPKGPAKQSGADTPTPYAQQRVRTATKMKSKSLSAPAYFGESCLWVPAKEWSTHDPFPYMYTTTAETRCELLYIPRVAIQEVLNSFSPWLPERFIVFTESVVVGLKTMMGEAKGQRLPITDWAAVDLDLPPPPEDFGMGELQKATLIRAPAAVPRTSSHNVRAGNRRSGGLDKRLGSEPSMRRPDLLASNMLP